MAAAVALLVVALALVLAQVVPPEEYERVACGCAARECVERGCEVNGCASSLVVGSQK